MALFFQKERGIIVLFFQKGRGMTVFFLNATSFGNTIGDLWEICGLSVAFYKCVSIIMLQKSSARKGFCAEGWRKRRVKGYLEHAGSVVFTKLPA